MSWYPLPILLTAMLKIVGTHFIIVLIQQINPFSCNSALYKNCFVGEMERNEPKHLRPEKSHCQENRDEYSTTDYKLFLDPFRKFPFFPNKTFLITVCMETFP